MTGGPPGRRPGWRLALALMLFTCWPAAAPACALQLVLAVDVSGSVDPDEYTLQTNGLAAAFETEVLSTAIKAQPGGILVTMTQWSGTSRQVQATGWHHLTDAASAAAFAAAIRSAPRAWSNYSTAIGHALRHAGITGDAAPMPCARRVIDISGDGASNEGIPPRPVAQALAARGIRINGLTISGASPEPALYYRAEVIAGPGAFVEEAADFADFPRAMLKKLLREIDAPLDLSQTPFRPGAGSPISVWSLHLATMVINARVIHGSDPGAVPGDSTNPPVHCGRWGRNRIDGRLKTYAFTR